VTVEFTIHGKVTSANSVTRHIGILVDQKAQARALKSKSAREDTERIKSIAFAAKVQAGWIVPHRARISILAYNSKLDVDNIAKTILDSIKKGLLIVDDRPTHLKSCFTDHQDPDHLGERYRVLVEDVAASLL